MHKVDGFRPAFITFAPMKNKIHIVGLRYYSWCGHMDELFAPDAPAHDRWIGQKLYLQRDLHCVEDEHAVMAWTVTDPVGHVAKVDLPLIAGVLEEGGRELVVATIVGLDAVRRALVVEPVDELPEVPCPVHEPEPWTWNGPVMRLPMMWSQSDHLGRMLNLMARGELPYDGEVVSRYMRSTVTDLSGDAYRNRKQLAQALLDSREPLLAEAGHTLLAVMDHMGGKEQMADWYNHVINVLFSTKEVQDMAMRHVEVDVQQVIAALHSFPLEIGREWLAGNIDLFARRLYYAQMPRTDILKLFSLIVLYDRACRRVQPAPVQPAVGVNLGGGCQLSVSTLENHGTMMNIEQARILPKH